MIKKTESGQFPTFASIDEVENDVEVIEGTTIEKKEEVTNKEVIKKVQPKVETDKYAPLDEAERKKDPNYLKEEEVKEEPEEETEPVETPNEESEDTINRFEALKEIGAFQGLPEDFEFDGSEEKLQEAWKIDQNYRDTQSELRILNQVQSNKGRELLELALQGADDSELEKIFQAQKREDSFVNTLPTNDEEKKEYASKYLKDIGNAEKIVKKIVEDAEDTGELEELVGQAKSHFEVKSKQQKEEIKKQTQERYNTQKKSQEEYEAQFMGALNKTKFTTNKKQEIVGAFDNVKFKDGGTMVKYQYLRALVENNPNHFIQYLDILNSYDPQKGFDFSGVKKEKTTEVVKSLKEKLATTGTFKTKSKSAENKQQISNLRNPVDRYVEIR